MAQLFATGIYTTIWTLPGGLAMNGTGGIAEASGNTLNLKNVNASSLIMPSFAQNNGSGEAVAEGNTVTLQGGTYGDSIFVSYASAAVNTARSGRNTVTLQGLPTAAVFLAVTRTRPEAPRPPEEIPSLCREMMCLAEVLLPSVRRPRLSGAATLLAGIRCTRQVRQIP